MKQKLDMTVKEIAGNREEIIAKLLDLAKTDVLFFWGENKELVLRQKEKWLPILDWSAELLKTAINKTNTLDVPENRALRAPLKAVLNKMSDKELACYLAATLNMRSTLLALALVKGKIHAEEACELSYLEELWQNEMWGTDSESAAKRQERCDELKEIENYLKS